MGYLTGTVVGLFVSLATWVPLTEFAYNNNAPVWVAVAAGLTPICGAVTGAAIEWWLS